MQRRLQHNEIIRKHKDKIKQQLKLQRELQAAMAQLKKESPTLENRTGQSTIFSSSSTIILPRPLSVQPYMCSSTARTDNHSASIWCVPGSSDKVPVAGLQLQSVQPKLIPTHSPAQTKRCLSTSLVEKHLVSPYNFGGFHVQEHSNKSFTKKVRDIDNVQDLPPKQTFLSTPDVTSRSPSISPITTAVVGCTVRNISRLLESPALSVGSVSHQNKRIGEDMSQQEEAFVKKRCTTSIGVTKQESLDLNSKRKEEDFTVVRPFSCPISFQDSVSTNNTEGKVEKQVKCSIKSKYTESPNMNVENVPKPSKTKVQPRQKEGSLKETKSYHFVQKPQVISRPDTCVITSPSISQNEQELTGRTRYNILNSLLSSDCELMPENKVAQPMPQTQGLATIPGRDQVPHLRRISCASNTSDTNGFRSAFVPVTSQKHALTHEELNKEGTCTIETMNQDVQQGDSCKDNDHKLVGSEGNNSSGISSVASWKENGFLSHFSCTTASSSSSSSSSTLCQSGDSVVSVVDSAFATPTPTTGNQKIPALTTASAPATLSKLSSSSSFAPAWLAHAAQSTNSGPDCTLASAGSPNFGPKKAVKNRFTPIRPKLDGSINISPQKLCASSTSASPQKRDMRPVHAILQEHRVKHAQDLLTNLAHNYQTEMGPSASGNVSSANIILSFGPLKSESSQKSTSSGAAALNVLSSLPLQNFPHKYTPRVIPSSSETFQKSQISPAVSITSLPKDSQVILLSTSPHKQTTSGDQPILVQDTKGNQYAMEKQPSGTLLLQPDFLSQPRETQVLCPSNLMSLNTKQAHMVGPDAQGQTYLLVPNSNQQLSQMPSKSCVPLTETSMETGASPNKSSISLTSVISAEAGHQQNQGKNVSEESEQTLQLCTAPSAFHKCSPLGSTNKLTPDSAKVVEGDSASKEYKQMDSEKDNRTTASNKIKIDDSMASPLQTKNKELANSKSLVKMINTCAQEKSMPQQAFRKRKAATGDCTEHEGKKRSEEGEDMENVEPSSLQESHKTENITSHFGKSSVHVEDQSSVQMSPLSDTCAKKTETETLLSMIGDTKSMTVKEVVLALNKLRAKLKAEVSKVPPVSKLLGTSAQVSTQDEKDVVKKVNASKIETSSLPHSEGSSEARKTKNMTFVSVTAPHPQRPSRRNISLNLESLEIDALLDLEPSLDSKLVGDIKEREVFKTGQQSERRASVGIAVKSHKPCDNGTEAAQLNPANIKCSRSKSLKRNDPAHAVLENKEIRPTSATFVDRRERCEKESSLSCMATKSLPLQQSKKKASERTGSCVQDILERGVSCKRNDVTHHFSSVVGLLNKDKNQDLAPTLILHKDRDQQKAKEQAYSGLQKINVHQTDEINPETGSESDLPLDVIDFITESMSDDNSYQSKNPITSWLADLASCVTGTEPTSEADFEKLSTPEPKEISKMHAAQGKLKSLFVDEDDTTNVVPMKIDTEPHAEQNIEEQIHILSANAASTPANDFFLSPTGPARSMRRPSMERSVVGDRSTSRASNEEPRPPSRLKARAETPVDSCTTPSDFAVSGKLSLAKRDPFSVRDHTTAVMLQQSVTLRTASQAVVELQPDTCITSFVRQGSAELCRADRALSETPVSDPGYSSVGQTPVSEVGGSSVSPSPVMMSLDSTFRPVKNDSEITQAINDTSTGPVELIGDPNNCATYQVLAPTVAEPPLDIQVSHGSTSLHPACPAAENSSKGDLHRSSHIENGTGISNLQNTLCALSDFDHLLSVRLQCIPTPPSSPSASPQPHKDTFNAHLPFGSKAEQKQSGKQNTSVSSFVAPLCPPNITPNSTTTSALYRINVTTNGSSLVVNPDFLSSGLMSRISPSPHLSVRPSCSPYQHYPHPSPPFTPSSQRCPTPSTIAMMSPRSNTPNTDSTAAPNRFMPIQTSGILATSMTVTQTYIQPIKPVVTLASALGQKNLSSVGPSLSEYIPTVSTSTLTSTTSMHQQYSCPNSDQAKINHHHIASSQMGSSASKRQTSKKSHQGRDNKPTSWTPSTISQKTHSAAINVNIEKTGQPALVLSLGGNIGSMSLSGQGMCLFDNQHSVHQSRALPSYQEAVSNMTGGEKQSGFSNQNVVPYHIVQGGLAVKRARVASKSAGSSSAAPVPGCSTNPGSKLMSQYTGTHGLPVRVQMSSQHSLGDSGVSSLSQSSIATQQDYQQSVMSDPAWAPFSGNSLTRKKASDGEPESYTSAFSMSHTPDDLEETLDVLKTLDSQYFQQDDDCNSTSL